MSKIKPIQQFEMPFSSESFNLAIEQTADGARIQQEREQNRAAAAENKAQHVPMFAHDSGNAAEQAAFDRQQSEALQREIGDSYEVIDGEMHLRGKFARPISDANQTETEARAMDKVRKSPGLRPGSYWSDPGMAKALATMQRGSK